MLNYYFYIGSVYPLSKDTLSEKEVMMIFKAQRTLTAKEISTPMSADSPVAISICQAHHLRSIACYFVMSASALRKYMPAYIKDLPSIQESECSSCHSTRNSSFISLLFFSEVWNLNYTEHEKSRHLNLCSTTWSKM